MDIKEETEGAELHTNAFLLVRQQALDTLQEEEERALGEGSEDAAPKAAPAEEDKVVVGISGNIIGQIIDQLDGPLQPGSQIGNVYEKPYATLEKIQKEEKDGYQRGFLDYRG